MPLLASIGSVSSRAYGFGAFDPIPVLAFGAGTFTTTDSATITFTSLGISTANTFRRVVVCCAYRTDVSTDASFPTVTVGGAATTFVVGSVNTTVGSVNRIGVAMYITSAYFPTGTTANIVITRGGTTLTRCFASTYSIVKNGTLVVVSSQTANTNPASLTSTKTAAQVGIAAGGAGTLSTLTSFSITGAVTSNYNSSPQEFGGLVTATNTGSGTVTYSAAGTSASIRSILVLWR